METDRTKLRRKPKRGSHERATIEAILDEALVSHLGFVDEGRPVVIPTLHARAGADVYLHGSAASRALSRSDGAEVCLTVTLVDGLVLARAATNHSANYRSAMVFGAAERIEEPGEKLAALETVVEKIVPGRWSDARRPSEKELRATSVLRIPLEEASAKVRSGGPLDEEEDMGLPVWAGVLPMRTVTAAPLPDALLTAGIQLPTYVADLVAKGEGVGPEGSNQSP